jgi:Predicted ferric reductase
MWLAVRSVWLESMLGGLDKMYCLHKWLGISALVFAVLYWSLVTVPKWLVRAGWIEWFARGKSYEVGSDIQWCNPVVMSYE